MAIDKVPTAILISGTGTNMEALIKAASAPDYPAKIVLVISNRPKAGGINIAQSHNIPTKIIDHKTFETREDFEAVLNEALKEAGTELLCGAGFTRLLTDDFVKQWRNKQLNIHPSLLPAFKGLHVNERVVEADVKITGCTVHFVRGELDNGPIISQAAVALIPGDTADSLRKRIQQAEHKLYPESLRLVASGAIRIVDERVIYNEPWEALQPLLVPPLITN